MRTTGSQRRLAAASASRKRVDVDAAPAAEDYLPLRSDDPPRAAPERKRRIAKNVFVSDESKPRSLFDSKPSQSALDLLKRKMGRNPRE